MPGPTVRDAFFELLRERGLTTLFANPGSTEIPLLTGLPGDLRFVLALHEASVVGMATGWALGSEAPALAILHTTAGLGNAVGALATARVNRVPLVVLVGQQDRRHLPFEPFLAGRLAGLAGEYPVWVEQPARAENVPDAVLRAEHEAMTHLGPALVIVPMDDWQASAEVGRERAAPERVVRAAAADSGAVEELAALLEDADRPALVAGALASDVESWSAIVELAERLSAPVWQESFGARPGFPQDHPLFAGHLPADRARLRTVLDGYDAVLCLGAAAFRQYAYAEGRFASPGIRVGVVTPDPAEAHRSAADVAVVAPPGPVCRELARRLPARRAEPPPSWRPAPLPPPAAGEPLSSGHVFDALAARLPRDAVVFEESPSSRPELLRRLTAAQPFGYIGPAMGGLGFALPASTGLRLARPDLPVVALIGDGSAMYSIQALWSAVEYGAGALFVILSNGGYEIMNMLARQQGGEPPWPSMGHLDLQGLAGAFGCAARRVADHDTLEGVLDEVVPALADRDAPLLLEVVVAPEPDLRPPSVRAAGTTFLTALHRDRHHRARAMHSPAREEQRWPPQQHSTSSSSSAVRGRSPRAAAPTRISTRSPARRSRPRPPATSPTPRRRSRPRPRPSRAGRPPLRPSGRGSSSRPPTCSRSAATRSSRCSRARRAPRSASGCSSRSSCRACSGRRPRSRTRRWGRSSRRTPARSRWDCASPSASSARSRRGTRRSSSRRARSRRR